MKSTTFSLFTIALAVLCNTGLQADESWVVDSTESWKQATKSKKNIEIKNGVAVPTKPEASFKSTVKSYNEKKSANSIIFSQTSLWENWKEVPKVGPKDVNDAPVLVTVKDKDYWFLARHDKKDEATGKAIPGYHAWHSTDMENWTHYGPVTDHRSRWVTTAEYVDGAFYIYYDYPNDEDPHVFVDRDLTDGKLGEDMGMVFYDPSHGSDCAMIRDDDGQFHIIYENWSHIDAKHHSWDSPVAGHAVSPDGLSKFEILDYAVDDRTTPTGKFATFNHPFNPEIMRYEIHEPTQNAYGDWTALKVGQQYYLFCDYHPANDEIRIGRWTSDSLNNQFTWCGELGNGHPDPTIAFAEGQFYLIQQRAKTDFISPGPWVDGVEARVGVDTSGNGKTNQWTDWQVVEESYSQKEGFTRIVETAPAQIDLTTLPAGYGFQIEYRTQGVADQTALPKINAFTLSFQ